MTNSKPFLFNKKKLEYFVFVQVFSSNTIEFYFHLNEQKIKLRANEKRVTNGLLPIFRYFFFYSLIKSRIEEEQKFNRVFKQ